MGSRVTEELEEEVVVRVTVARMVSLNDEDVVCASACDERRANEPC